MRVLGELGLSFVVVVIGDLVVGLDFFLLVICLILVVIMVLVVCGGGGGGVW